MAAPPLRRRSSSYTPLDEELHVHVYSLDAKERRRLAVVLERRLNSVGDISAVVLQQPLLRSELKGIKLRANGRPHMIVLCHYNEGRVLMTDTDGLYNDFLVAACDAAAGNVFVALTPVAPTPSSDSSFASAADSSVAAAVADEATVSALAYGGQQRALLTLHAQRRFLTWDREPGEAHFSLLEKALRGQLPRLQVPESIADYASRARRARASTAFCDIL